MIYLDFEYNNTQEGIYNLVCCVTYDGKDFTKWWLHKDKTKWKALKEYLISKRKETFVSWAVSAEAGSMVSLGINPLEHKWVDLQMEYKMLLNHWEKYRFGKQVIKGKKVETTAPGKKEFMTEEEKEAAKSNTPESNLVAACYKLLGIEVDSERKDLMRDLILSNPEEFTPEQKEEILEYCKDDVIGLPFLLEKFKEIYSDEYFGDETIVESKEIFWRGRAGAMASLISYLGYPINRKQLDTLSKNIPKIMSDLCEDINSQLPTSLFTWMKREGRYKKNMDVLQKAISECPYADEWPLTASGKYSTSNETLEDYFDYKHSYPKGDIIAQYIRFIKTETSLKSLRPQDDKRKMIQSVIGKDDRCRAYLNPYGSQTARFQPPSTQFLFLKSAWLRSLCQPKKGNVIISMDYASQEFLLGAVLANDEDMYKAYLSGDIYMTFGYSSGIIPEGGLKKDYKIERAMCKSAVLGISYGMGKRKLAVKISRDTGVECDVLTAASLIKNFNRSYSAYSKYRENTLIFYEANKFLKSIDGWVLWGDNPSATSVMNFPVQAAGSAILRKALELCLGNKLSVIAPLHDAIYIECNLEEYEEKIAILARCMREASAFWFKEKEQKKWAKNIRLDADVWGPGLKKESKEILVDGYKIPYTTQEIYVDERGLEEYEKFSKYFELEV